MARIRVSILGARGQGAQGAVPLLRRAAGAAFFHLRPTFDAAVDIRLVGPAEMQAINRRHRGVDRPTDVLSFPLQDFAVGAPCFNPRQEAALTGGIVLLGDIVLSAGQAAVQAREYGHNLERECAYLTVHSMLHLMGFDHEAAADKALMRRHEEAVMARLGLGR